MTTLTFYVYLYEDPRTGTPRYVGKGCGNRVKQHTYNITTNKWLNTMIRQCADQGIEVRPTIFDCASEDEAFALEIELIAKYGRKDKNLGPLFNHTDGGEGRSGFVTPENVRRKISEALTGEKHPAFGKKGELCPNYGRKQSEAQRLNTSQKLTGRKQSPESVQKRAASNTGKKRTEEQRANLRAGQAKRWARLQGENV